LEGFFYARIVRAFGNLLNGIMPLQSSIRCCKKEKAPLLQSSILLLFDNSKLRVVSFKNSAFQHFL